MVERDVVIVRGDYHSSPVKGRGKNQVEFYGKQILPGGGGAGGGSGTYGEFLKWVGEWIERPVVSEVDPKPEESFEWFCNARSPFTEQMRREDHVEKLVLQHLQEQTGLTFTRGKKVVPILFIEEAQAYLVRCADPPMVNRWIRAIATEIIRRPPAFKVK